MSGVVSHVVKRKLFLDIVLHVGYQRIFHCIAIAMTYLLTPKYFEFGNCIPPTGHMTIAGVLRPHLPGQWGDML